MCYWYSSPVCLCLLSASERLSEAQLCCHSPVCVLGVFSTAGILQQPAGNSSWSGFAFRQCSANTGQHPTADWGLTPNSRAGWLMGEGRKKGREL